MFKKYATMLGAITTTTLATSAVIACGSTSQDVPSKTDHLSHVEYRLWVKNRVSNNGKPEYQVESSLRDFVNSFMGYPMFLKDTYLSIQIGDNKYEVNKGKKGAFSGKIWNVLRTKRYDDNNPQMYGEMTKAIIDAIIPPGKDRAKMYNVALIAMKNSQEHFKNSYTFDHSFWGYDFDATKDVGYTPISWAFTKQTETTANIDKQLNDFDNRGLMRLFHGHFGFSKGVGNTTIHESIYQVKDNIKNDGSHPNNLASGTVDTNQEQLTIRIGKKTTKHVFTQTEAKQFIALHSKGSSHAAKIMLLANLVWPKINNDKIKFLESAKVALETSWHKTEISSIIVPSKLGTELLDKASLHAVFHKNSGRSLPTIGEKLYVEINGTPYTHTWAATDNTAIGDKYKQNQGVSQRDMMLYIAKQMAKNVKADLNKLKAHFKVIMGLGHIQTPDPLDP